jgi:uncharacterized protein YcfJ
MFKFILGAMVGALVANQLSSRKARAILTIVLAVAVVVIEIIFVANGGD